MGSFVHWVQSHSIITATHQHSSSCKTILQTTSYPPIYPALAPGSLQAPPKLAILVTSHKWNKGMHPDPAIFLIYKCQVTQTPSSHVCLLPQSCLWESLLLRTVRFYSFFYITINANAYYTCRWQVFVVFQFGVFTYCVSLPSGKVNAWVWLLNSMCSV